MTRETKIGLLVGLAFIIVVAILLTDHASSVNDPKPAAQSDAGPNVRQSVTTPSTAGPTAGAEAPRSPVPTRGDLTPRDPSGPPVRIVEVGPGATPPGLAGEPPIGLPPMEPARGPATPPTGIAGRNTNPGRAPADLVSEHPEDFTHIGGGTNGNGSNTGGTASNGTKPPAGGPAKPVPPVTPPKTYTAEAGDTVSRIAAKQMAGGNSKANRDALIKANPSLQGEGNIVYLGKPYVIPSPGAAAQAADATPSPTKPATPTPPAFPTPPAVGANATWYTVKDNDNLWRIAARELGDGNLWTTIRDINKDVLKGGETVKANMRIRLPKSTATASVN